MAGCYGSLVFPALANRRLPFVLNASCSSAAMPFTRSTGITSDWGSTPISASRPRTAPKTSAELAKSRHCSPMPGWCVSRRSFRPIKSIAPAPAAAGQQFHEVYVKAELAVCEKRDPKGLYSRARTGEIADFTGISSPYEPPLAAELTVETDKMDIAACVAEIVDYVERHFRLPSTCGSERRLPIGGAAV